MTVLLTNNATSTLAASISDAATAITIQAPDVGKFPSPTGDDWSPITVVNASGNLEIMRCTGRSGATLTVERGKEGTTAFAFDAGDRVDIRLTAGTLTETLGDKATLDSPTFTGNPKAPTQDPEDSSNNIATTEYVDDAIGELGSMSARDVTISQDDPSGGEDGDVWLVYE